MVTPSTLSYCDKMIQNTSKYSPLHKIVILQLHLPRYGWGRKSSRLAIQSQVGTHVASRVRWRRDNDRRLQHHQPYNLAISGNLWQSLAISGNLWQSLAISGNSRHSHLFAGPPVVHGQLWQLGGKFSANAFLGERTRRPISQTVAPADLANSV